MQTHCSIPTIYSMDDIVECGLLNPAFFDANSFSFIRSEHSLNRSIVPHAGPISGLALQ